MANPIWSATVNLNQCTVATFARIRSADFDAITLSIDQHDFLTDSTFETRIIEAARLAQEHDLPIAAAMYELNTPPDPDLGADRDPQAFEHPRRIIESLQSCNDPTLILSPPPDTYSRSLNTVYRTLDELCTTAECNGVQLAIHAPHNNCLLSPVELRELIDRIASPIVSTCLNLDELIPITRLYDWLNTLGPHVTACSVQSSHFKDVVERLAHSCRTPLLIISRVE